MRLKRGRREIVKILERRYVQVYPSTLTALVLSVWTAIQIFKHRKL